MKKPKNRPNPVTPPPVSIEPLEKMLVDLNAIVELARARTKESVDAAITLLNYRRFGGDDTVSFNRIQFILAALRDEARQAKLK